MRITKNSIFSLIVLLCMMPTAYAKTKIGVVHQLEGRAEAVYQGAKRTLKPGMAVFEQESVRTYRRSTLIITLRDGSQIALDKSTEVTLRKYQTKPRPDSVFAQSKGRLHSVVSKFFSKRDNSYRIETPTAVVGVKGTAFVTDVDRRCTTVWVTEGVVEDKNIDAGVVGTELVRRAQMNTVCEGEPPTKPRAYATAARATSSGGTSKEGAPAQTSDSESQRPQNIDTQDIHFDDSGVSTGSSSSGGNPTPSPEPTPVPDISDPNLDSGSLSGPGGLDCSGNNPPLDCYLNCNSTGQDSLGCGVTY